MKNLKVLIPAFLFLFSLSSCLEEDTTDDQQGTPPSTAEFDAVRTTALDGITKNHTIAAGQGYTQITSDNGVQIGFSTSGFTLNGAAVTGDIDFKYAEIFDRGSMLTTNKPTMGLMPDGKKGLLISGGEFFMEASQNGQVLDYNGGVSLTVPTSLTGAPDNAMTIWTGNTDNEGDLTWEEEQAEIFVGEDTTGVGTAYYAYFSTFGWTNVDRFYNDPRPKTTIKVDVPENYDNTNSAVYLAYVGEPVGLAHLDTYLTDEEVFTEHYGLIPIGLECHVIFVTEEDGGWRYAVKSVTVVEDEIITITYDETAVVTETQIEAIINALN